MNNQVRNETDRINLKKIMAIVEGYEIEVIDDEKGRTDYFTCIWKAPGLLFNIDLGWKTTGAFREDKNETTQIIYVVELSKDYPITMEWIESIEATNKFIIIFDPDEDIQLFSKDFWNLIVFLNASRG